MVAADEFLGVRTVRTDTIQSLKHPRQKRAIGRYQDLPRMQKDEIVYQYVRGYWITRYLMDRHAGLLNNLLDKKHSRRTTENMLAGALGLRRRSLWKQIDGIVIQHFESRCDST